MPDDSKEPEWHIDHDRIWWLRRELKEQDELAKKFPSYNLDNLLKRLKLKS